MAPMHLQPSFSGGEISPSLQARVDSPAYNTWLHTARNFYVHPQGGASNRPGTLFVGKAKYTNKPCRVIPFVISEDESYVIEFGHQYLRFYTSAGRVLDNLGEIYEVESPYFADELDQLQYVQHNQSLFLVHPLHAPQRLARTAVGRFSLQPLPVSFGPFAPSNSDESKKLRVIQYQDTVHTDGVKAAVSFLPSVDPNYFVWGYFNNERFFYGQDYGFDLDFFVSEFNRVYGTNGFTAYNLGGVIKIESPQATGGNCNGMTLMLEYRNSFTAPAVYTMSQTLRGGVNAGDIEVEGGDHFILQSDFDLFEPGNVGGRFSVTHLVENQNYVGTIGYDGTSSSLKTSGDFELHLAGSWTGQIVLEKSTDLGVSWSTYKTFTRADGDEAIYCQDSLADTNTLYYLRLRGLNITGEAGYELNAQSFLQEGIVVVTDFISARQVQVSVEQPFGSDGWTSNWAVGSFSSKNGFPSCVFFYQDRLGFAGTAAEPQTLWFSKTSDYTNFGHSRLLQAADDSISIQLSGKELNAIRSVAVCGRLVVFTSGSEWSITCNGVFSPSNLLVSQLGQRGASLVTPLLIGNRILFVQARAGTLRDFYYDYASASFIGEDLTLCAKHLFFNQQIRQLCYQQEPDQLLWCVLSNGQLAALTYLPEQNICAWTHHDTQGAFRSICTVAHHGYDEVWLSVERANGWNIEKLSGRLVSKEPQDQVFLDAAVSFKAEDSFTQLTGLTHLEGQQVGILADGMTLPSQTVSNGTITLPEAATSVQVGLSYTSQLKTLPFSTQQTGAQALYRPVSVTLQLLDTCGGSVGSSLEMLEEIIFRSNENFNEPIGLKTGYYSLVLRGVSARGEGIWVVQTQPLPITLLAFKVQLA